MVVAVVQIVSVRVYLGNRPNTDVDKAWIHESLMKKNWWKQASVYRCTVFSLSILHSFSFTSSYVVFYFLLFLPFLDSSISHTRSGKQANSHAIVVHVFIMFWQLCSSKNGIILSWRWTQTGSNCAITQTVCWMTWTGLTEIKASRVYCPVRWGGWFICFCRISKHLDLLWGAGYPKIPPKSILFLLHQYLFVLLLGCWSAKAPKPTSKNVNISILFQKIIMKDLYTKAIC